MKPKLVIRADAGGSIGTGHVMRMLALAQAYIADGGLVTLVSVICPESLVQLLESHGVKHIFLEDVLLGDRRDAQLTVAIANKLSANWVVSDGYHFGYDFQKEVKKSDLSLLCVDDHGYSDRWMCDALLNQNLDSEYWGQQKSDLEPFQQLLGSSYCLLRSEFLAEATVRKPWRKIDNLLITLGGSDPDNATRATLQLLKDTGISDINIRVLVGADNPHYESLSQFSINSDLTILKNITDMPEQYAWADGIISAGGSTCWEWLNAGLPGAIVTIADNQLPLVQALTVDRLVALSLGDYRNFRNDMDLVSNLSNWLENPSQGLDRKKALLLIDGKGASRVSQFLRNN